VFRNEIAIEYREAAADAVLRGGKGIGVLQAEAEAEALQRRLAAERAVDSVLADSFPASDPPSWTLGITHPQPEHQATNAEAVAPDAGRAVDVKADLIDVSSPGADGRTFLKGLVSLAGAAGIALLVPFVILMIGMPIALAVGGVVEAASWLIGLIFG
jgi:hypothetical protein